MKLTFWPNDSIYKIVQTMKKIPNYKSALIDIHPENRIFFHTRWGNYLLWVIKEHHLDVTFLSHNKHTRKYLDQAWLVWKNKDLSFFEKVTDLQSFRSHINKFHQHLILQKNYLSVFVLLAEFSVLLTVLYVFRTLISPNAVVQITPAYQLENVVYNFRYYPHADVAAHQFQNYLSVPYYTWSIPYTYDMSANVQNITYSQKPAQGTVVIKNTFPYTYSLLDKTRIITDEGISYTFNKRIDVPWGSADSPWLARIRVTADERFENWELIGEEGNIPKWKILRLKNLEESTKDKKIWAESYSQFSKWETIAKWTVIEKDIQSVEANIMETIQKNKKRYLVSSYTTEWHILLPDEDLYQIKINEFNTTSELWEASSFVEGKVDANIEFPYVKRDDIQKWVESYLTQRAEDEIHLTSFDRKSLTLYDIVTVAENQEKEIPWYYIIPTKLPVIKKYNIEKDSLGIINEIKDKVAWLEIAQAKNIILSYDEIDAAKVKITPRWYSIIPDIKSRISFEFAK